MSIRLYSLLIILTGILLSGLYAVAHYWKTDNVTLELAQQSVIRLDQKFNAVQTKVSEISANLFYLSNLEGLRDYLDDEGSSTSLGVDLINFSQSKTRYDQIRYIDEYGMEKIRINLRNNSVATRVAETDLQNKAERYYFTESLNLPKGQLFISPLDLNIEHGRIEIPLKPAIRYATPVFDRSGKRRGIFVLNYLAQELIHLIQHQDGDLPNVPLLLNDLGYYLVGPSSDVEWGFMFADKQHYTFQNEYPAAWKIMQTQKSGQVINKQGIFTFSHFDPAQLNGSQCDNCTWRMVLHIPEKFVAQKVNTSLYQWAPLLVLLWMITAVTAWIGLKNRHNKREMDRRMQQLNSSILQERDLFVGGPTVLFKRRNAFGWPVEYVSGNVTSVLGYHPQQFLSQELTFSSIVAPEHIRQVSFQLNGSQDDSTDAETPPYEIVDAQGRHRWVRDHMTLIRDEAGNITHFYGYLNDITPLKQAQEELAQSREHLKTIINTIADPTLVINVDDYRVMLSNRSALETYANGQEGQLPLTCHQLSHKRTSPCSGEHDPCPIKTILQTGEATSVVHEHFDSNNNSIFVEVHATPIKDENDKVVQIIESHRDITSRLHRERQLKTLASTDHLTKTHNRMGFEKALNTAVVEAKTHDIQIGLIMFDLDRFKRINDRLGHDMGDQILQEIVEVTYRVTRRSDLLARWGGEEFMILATDVDADGIRKMAEQLRMAIEAYEFGITLPVTVSCGVTVLTDDDTLESLVKRADEALYMSKHSGRNCTTFIGA